MTWVPVPRRDLRDIYDCPRWFERAILKSRQCGEPAEYVVWVGQGERSQIICTLWDMEAPLPLEPVAELADGAIFRVNAAFDSAGARQSAYAARVSGEPAVREMQQTLPLLAVIGVAMGLLLLLAVAIFQPGYFQQMLVSTTSIVSSMGVSVRTRSFDSVEAPVLEEELEFASFAAALQRTEAELAAARSELASKVQVEAELAEVRAELERTQSVLTRVEAEVAVKNIELEELASVQTALLNAEQELAAIQTERADFLDSEANEQLAIADTSVPKLTTATRTRTGPGEAFEVTEILPNGASVQLTGIDVSGRWYLLSSFHWVPVANVSGRIPEALPVVTLGSVLVDANLRQEPTTNSPILGTAREGQTVVLIRQQEGSQPAGTWYLLASGYWIYGDLVTELSASLP